LKILAASCFFNKSSKVTTRVHAVLPVILYLDGTVQVPSTSTCCFAFARSSHFHSWSRI